MGKKLTLNVEGTEFTKKDLKDRFEKYNKLYFYGKLVDILPRLKSRDS